MGELVKVSEQRVKAGHSAAEFAEQYFDKVSASGVAVSKMSVGKAGMEAAVARAEVESDHLIHNSMKMLRSIFSLAPTYIEEYLDRKRLNGYVLESELAATTASVELAEYNLKRAVMTSPVDGGGTEPAFLQRTFSVDR